jgi:hypothetical protein
MAGPHMKTVCAPPNHQIPNLHRRASKSLASQKVHVCENRIAAILTRSAESVTGVHVQKFRCLTLQRNACTECLHCIFGKLPAYDRRTPHLRVVDAVVYQKAFATALKAVAVFSLHQLSMAVTKSKCDLYMCADLRLRKCCCHKLGKRHLRGCQLGWLPHGRPHERCSRVNCMSLQVWRGDSLIQMSAVVNNKQ